MKIAHFIQKVIGFATLAFCGQLCFGSVEWASFKPERVEIRSLPFEIKLLQPGEMALQYRPSCATEETAVLVGQPSPQVLTIGVIVREGAKQCAAVEESRTVYLKKFRTTGLKKIERLPAMRIDRQYQIETADHVGLRVGSGAQKHLLIGRYSRCEATTGALLAVDQAGNVSNEVSLLVKRSVNAGCQGQAYTLSSISLRLPANETKLFQAARSNLLAKEPVNDVRRLRLIAPIKGSLSTANGVLQFNHELFCDERIVGISLIRDDREQASRVGVIAMHYVNQSQCRSEQKEAAIVKYVATDVRMEKVSRFLEAAQSVTLSDARIVPVTADCNEPARRLVIASNELNQIGLGTIQLANDQSHPQPFAKHACNLSLDQVSLKEGRSPVRIATTQHAIVPLRIEASF